MSHEKRKISIGKYELDAWYEDNARDGYSYSIEAEGNADSSIGQKFLIPYFKGIRVADLPDSIDLNIYYKSSYFKRINFIKLRKKKSSSLLSIVLCIDHVDWEMPESVGSFVDRYITIIKNENKYEVAADRTEYGYFINCDMKIGANEEIYEKYKEFEYALEKLYRKSILVTVNRNEKIESYGNSRLHWWIRYVIVPLAGSGTIALVIGKYLLK